MLWRVCGLFVLRSKFSQNCKLMLRRGLSDYLGCWWGKAASGPSLALTFFIAAKTPSSIDDPSFPQTPSHHLPRKCGRKRVNVTILSFTSIPVSTSISTFLSSSPLLLAFDIPGYIRRIEGDKSSRRYQTPLNIPPYRNFNGRSNPLGRAPLSQ